jgi:copper transport protein
VPVAPSEIILEFTETTDPEFTTAQLYDSNATLIHEAPLLPRDDSGLVLAFTPPPLADGTYTVVWRNVSAVDGHPLKGSFSFHVGERSQGGPAPVAGLSAGGPPKALSVFGRWATFAAHVLLVGIAASAALVLAPALARTDAPSSLVTALGRLVARLWWGSMVAAVLAAVLAVVLQAWRSAGAFSDGLDALSTLVADTRFGHLWLVRIVLLGLMAYGTLLVDRRLFGGAGLRTPWYRATDWLVMLAAGLGLMATMSLNSHAAASSDGWREADTLTDFIHAAGAGIWVGGLVTLAAAVSLFLRSEYGAPLLRAVVPRFSLLAFASVLAISVTGALQWYLRVGNLDDTVDSGYGHSLIVKSLLLVPMLGFAAVNLLVFRPALRDATAALVASTGRFLRRHVIAEAALGALILLATAFLTDTSPPPSTAARAPSSLLVADEQDDLRVEVTLTPGRAGADDIAIAIDDRQAPEEPVRNVILRLRYLDDDFGQSDEDVVERGNGVYGVANAQLGVPGRWEILAIVQRQGVRDVTMKWEVDLAPALAQ